MLTKSKILILGGTEFVGRQLVEQLLRDKSVDVYLFNRGKTNADLFPEANRIIGDRETEDIEKISQHKWDYVIDFSSYFPDSLERTLQNINRDVKKYVYISTISVYDLSELKAESVITEDFKLKKYEREQLAEPSLKFYGEKKVACEDVLNNALWLNSIILRPSVIFGKYDPTERLYYWIHRIKHRDKIILPDNGGHILSMTYAVDLVNTLLKCIDSQVPVGTYNCVSDERLKFKDVLNLIKQELDSNCSFVPASSEKLNEEKLTPREFPFWWGIDLSIDASKIKVAHQASFTTLREALRETINHYKSEGWPMPQKGLAFEEEERLIEKFSPPRSNS